MSGIQRYELADGTDVIWTIPLSGMGHVADEQPLPYLHHAGVELTPRFGGEEQIAESGISSLPLPYGILSTSWPWRQRVFNLTRRRINIYWRNLFIDATRKDRAFYFIEQLEFQKYQHGFVGTSPTVKYQRSFDIHSNTIKINDSIEFKQNVHFSELYLCPWADFKAGDQKKKCHIQATLPVNCSHPIKSATGTAWWHAHKLLDVKYKKGDQVTWSYTYQIE